MADDGTVIASRFETYESLPATKANLALLSMAAQHPGATVNPGGITVDGSSSASSTD